MYSPSVSLLNNFKDWDPPSILPIILVTPEAIPSNQIGMIASPSALATIGNTIAAFPVEDPLAVIVISIFSITIFPTLVKYVVFTAVAPACKPTWAPPNPIEVANELSL